MLLGFWGIFMYKMPYKEKGIVPGLTVFMDLMVVCQPVWCFVTQGADLTAVCV